MKYEEVKSRIIKNPSLADMQACCYLDDSLQENGYISWAKASPGLLRERGYVEPEGLVIHFTAGHWDRKGKDGLSSAKKNGFTYLFLEDSGDLYQGHSLYQYGSHAGSSYWEGVGSNVSKKLIGLEIACSGKLKRKNGKYVTWFDREVKEDQVRYHPGDSNIQRGYYQIFTDEQLQSLERLIMTLYFNFESFKVENIVGHDEVAVPFGRKNDPGYSLPVTLPEYRVYIANRIREITGCISK